MIEKKKKLVKGRDWTFIVYPESAPENWRDILNQTHLEWVESPLHNKDVNSDGSKKKAHWHILLRFSGPVTIKRINDIIEPLNTPIPQKVGSAKGMVRYFAHMDNPEKYQYSIEDIRAHNGADIADFFKLSSSQNLHAMKQIFQFIKAKEIDNYIDFLNFCLEQGNDDWFDIAINHNTLAINKMLDAMWQKHQGLKAKNK
ncbi:Plasmid replication protein, partial [Kosakonia oryzendophytica]